MPVRQGGSLALPGLRGAAPGRAARVDSCCDALQELTAARVREERAASTSCPLASTTPHCSPVLALGEYGGDLQRLILAWKNGGMLHLGARIAPALTPAVELLADPTDGAPVQLVPVPSQRSARLRRGEDHTAELVRAMERSGAGRALLLDARPTTAQDGQGARQRRTRQILLSGPSAHKQGERRRP